MTALRLELPFKRLGTERAALCLAQAHCFGRRSPLFGNAVKLLSLAAIDSVFYGN